MDLNGSAAAGAVLWGFAAVRLALTAGASYFLGCFNGAVIVSKYILKKDVREYGSGNAGLTNFYRTFGGPLTFAVILCDMLKAALSVELGAWLAGGALGWPAFGRLYAGLFCMVGHMFPWMFRFRGGKGVLCGGTMALLLDWRVALVVWGGFLVLFLLTRYVSLGSIFAGAAFPFAVWFVFRAWPLTLLAALCGGLLIWGHRSNLRRLLSGTESKLTFHRSGGTPK